MSKGPATTSLAYQSMLPAWNKVQTVLDGTKAMRRAGKQYLPQHSQETNEAYKERLDRATLYNLTKITQQSLVGRPFSDPIHFPEDFPSAIEELSDDVDLQGTDIQVFARDWFADGLAKAYSHVLVDFPRLNTEEGVPRTLADDSREGVRPYLVHIRPEQLIFARAEVIAGSEQLVEIRVWEEINEVVGFEEVAIPQIRRLFRDDVGVTVEIYQLEDPRKEGTDQEEWMLVESFPFGLDLIPLVTFYADRCGFMEGVPPLEDLADLNIAHWQSTSDQRAVLTVARFPMLALSGGAPESGDLVVGPNTWLHCPDSSGRFYFVEHSGKAIASGRQDLLDLESQMEAHGAEFLKKKPGGMTATARALDSAEATSALQDMTLRFTHALNQALSFMGLWMKIDNIGEGLSLPTDFGPEDVSDAELSTLRETRKNRDMSRRAYLEELKRRGLLSDSYNIEEDAELIEQETAEMIGTILPEEETNADQNEGRAGAGSVGAEEEDSEGPPS